MLEIGKANEVKFKVEVNGTQAPPTVRIVIGTPEAELGFKAEKLLGSDTGWFSEVLIPNDVKAGEYDMRVEVVVNNRLFTPIKRKVQLGTKEPMMAAENVEPPHPTQKPKQTETWEGEGGALPEVPEKPVPLPSKPLVVPPQKPVKSLMKDAAAKAPVKEHKKINTPLPKPSTKKAEPVRISISEISAESNKRFEKVLKESASYRKPGVSVTPMNITHQTPVTLKKGEIIYE